MLSLLWGARRNTSLRDEGGPYRYEEVIIKSRYKEAFAVC